MVTSPSFGSRRRIMVHVSLRAFDFLTSFGSVLDSRMTFCSKSPLVQCFYDQCCVNLLQFELASQANPGSYAIESFAKHCSTVCWLCASQDQPLKVESPGVFLVQTFQAVAQISMEVPLCETVEQFRGKIRLKGFLIKPSLDRTLR